MLNEITIRIGHRSFRILENASELVWLFISAARETFVRPFYSSLFLDQFYNLIYRSLPLVLVTAISTGSVMALQFGFGMERFGGKLYVPTVVTLSLVRELGPVFTCLMLAGRVGAGIAAELGSMTVTQQVDAIRALGTSPLKKLVIPRLLALIIGAPLLTLLADFFGIIGGLLVSMTELNIGFHLYVQKSYQAVTVSDVIVGTGKTVFFGLFIGLISCWHGLRRKQGTSAVGHATTHAVVLSSIFIVVSDFLLTKFFWIFKW